MCFEAHVPLEVPLSPGRVVTAGPRAGIRFLTRVRQHVHPEVAGSRGRVVTAGPRAGIRFLTRVRQHVRPEVAVTQGRVVTAGPRAGVRFEAHLICNQYRHLRKLKIPKHEMNHNVIS
jgi:hypothetical protein